MFISTILFFVTGSFCIGFSVQDPVKMELYYEGLCPYCHEFIEDQVYPTYETLGSDADSTLLIDWIPYGNARYVKHDDGTVKFECQHGEEECLINRIHACAINQNSTKAKLINFIYCTIKGSDVADDILQLTSDCANDNGLSYDDINSCVSSTLSDDLLLAYADRQSKLNPPLPYVPYIIFNGVHDDNTEGNARENLLGTVCDLLEGPKPKACNKIIKKFHRRQIKSKTSSKN